LSPPSFRSFSLERYVWLMMHLRDKDASLYTGLEMHVAPLLKDHNNRAMLLNKSRAIQGKQVKERATLPTLLSKVNGLGAASGAFAARLDHVTDRLAELTAAVEKGNASAAQAAAASQVFLHQPPSQRPQGAPGRGAGREAGGRGRDDNGPTKSTDGKEGDSAEAMADADDRADETRGEARDEAVAAPPKRRGLFGRRRK
jgi:uncharacterized protein YoxC